MNKYGILAGGGLLPLIISNSLKKEEELLIAIKKDIEEILDIIFSDFCIGK